ncbi:LysR substrate-binding domain-containing protein [Frankia sp. CiP3]|uniref:LysR substrate-binding domain-containing protein n=1 Tax=Frankia sp. CiP3 TaxID=2880971 RepID=UPI001EF41D9D|nr:LysR substrate-binding domain-containing protein [Frankia sp. CiP3]
MRLFERTSRRVVLTAVGERFVQGARTVLAELECLWEIAAEEAPGDGQGPRVGILGFGAADHWQALREMVDAQQPGLALEFRDLDLLDQYDAVRRGEVDVAIVQFVGELDGVDFVPVLSSPRVAVIPASSPASEASFLTLSDLEGLGWLEVASREPLLRTWVGAARRPGAVSVRHPAAIPAAVATAGRASLHAAATGGRRWPRSAALRPWPIPCPPRSPTRGRQGRIATSSPDDPAPVRLLHCVVTAVTRRPRQRCYWEQAVIMATQRTVVRGGHVLSMDPRIGELRQGDVLIEDGVITAVDLPALLTRAETSAEDVLGRVNAAVPVLPGGFVVIRDLASANLYV